VAVFTFSKKRCDIAADACSGMDLTTAAEKHTIHTFVQSVLSRLREGDRELPQVRVGVSVLRGWGKFLEMSLCTGKQAAVRLAPAPKFLCLRAWKCTG
jgi:hypothetical protein